MVTVKAPKDKIMCGTGLALSAPQVFPDIEGTFPYSFEETKSKIPQMLY